MSKFIYAILQVFGLWLPPTKGRSGTPAVATKSWYKNKNKKIRQTHKALIYVFFFFMKKIVVFSEYYKVF